MCVGPDLAVPRAGNPRKGQRLNAQDKMEGLEEGLVTPIQPPPCPLCAPLPPSRAASKCINSHFPAFPHIIIFTCLFFSSLIPPLRPLLSLPLLSFLSPSPFHPSFLVHFFLRLIVHSIFSVFPPSPPSLPLRHHFLSLFTSFCSIFLFYPLPPIFNSPYSYILHFLLFSISFYFPFIHHLFVLLSVLPLPQLPSLSGNLNSGSGGSNLGNFHAPVSCFSILSPVIYQRRDSTGEERRRTYVRIGCSSHIVSSTNSYIILRVLHNILRSLMIHFFSFSLDPPFHKPVKETFSLHNQVMEP